MKTLVNSYFKYLLKYRFSTLSLVLLCIFWLLPGGFVIFPDQGLDWSWMAEINWAYQKGYVFGQDLIFTYGPLGWLITRLDFMLPTNGLILFDIILYTTIGCVLFHILNRFRDVVYGDGILATLFSVYFLAIMSDPLILMLIILQISIFEHNRTRSVRWLVLACFISVIGFFIKLNTAFIYILLLGFYLLYCILMAVDTQQKKGVIVFFLGHLLLIVITSHFLRLDLTGYVFYGLKTISGYQDGMQIFSVFLENHTRHALPPLVFGIIIACLIWFGGLFLIRQFVISPFDGLIWVNVSVSFFVIFKHAFTYYSQGPANEVFTTAPALLGVGLLYLTNPKSVKIARKAWKIVAFFSILGVAFLHSWSKSPWHLPYVDQLLYSSVGRKSISPDISGRILDTNSIARIGQKTVDVFPDHLDFALYNQLNHRPRPSIQAYTTGFSPDLQKLNYDFYLGPKAPAFVLFEAKAIRNPLYESFTRLALLQRYQLVDTAYSLGGDSLLVLAKHNQKVVEEVLQNIQKIALGEWIEVGDETSQIPWLRAEVSYSLGGFFQKFFLHPPKLWMEVRYSDQTQKKWPVSFHTLTQGFPLLKLENTGDFTHWFLNQPDQIQRIKAVRFYSDQNGFSNEMIYQLSYKSISR